MKVRVLKEMPFAKVGDVYDLIENGGVISPFQMIPRHIEMMLNSGWLEEVKEESLGDKFFNSLEENIEVYIDTKQKDLVKVVMGGLTQIAKEHYLEVFDNAYTEHNAPLYKKLRKALEQA